MQFAVSTWLWTSPFKNETIELFSKIAKMGFSHVEIAVEDPNLIDPHAIKDALDHFGLIPIVCGAFGPTRDLTHEDPHVHQICFDYLDRCFEFCNIWGASFVAGPMYSAVGKARMVSAEQKKMEWDRAVTNLHKVCQQASSYGLEIAIEALNRFETDLINTTDDLVRLIGDINHPVAKILLDSFHMTIEERNLEEAIRLAGDKVIHVQVSENYRGTPGSGQTRWDDIKRGLDVINYDGVISIESFTPNVKELAGAVCIWKPFADSQDQFAIDGLKFLKSTFDK